MISVVIPTHNRVDLLPRAIKSVQNQTVKDLEIIVVSDGSTDGTDELMKKLSQEDSCIKYISYYPGHNGNYARNTGIKAAKGEFIAFLDDDDEWLPTKLEEQITLMESDDNIGLVYTGTHVIYVDEKIKYSSLPNKCGDLSREILFVNCIGSTTTVMVRSSVFEKVGWFDEQLPAIQDYDLWIRICQVSSVGVIPKELVNYYNYRSSGQVSANTKKYEDAYAYVDKKYSYLYKDFSKDEWNYKMSIEKLGLGMRAKRNGIPGIARKYYKQSLGYKFSLKTCLLYLLSFVDYSFTLKVQTLKKNNF